MPVEAAFAALMQQAGPFEPQPLLAVAVSGGPDSMALLRLARDWARAQDGQVLALTVDHRLRPDSSHEAEQVARWAAGLGVPHRLLAWVGPKPASGIQHAAREARYALLAQACIDAGIVHLLLAHHADDQAETVWHRQARGSGPLGLAGMPLVAERSWGRLVRPLLTVGKADLRAYCQASDLAFVDDPSNSNLRFARAKLRAQAQADSATAQALAGMAAHAAAEGQQRSAVEQAIAALMAQACVLHPEGWAEILPAPVIAAPPALACAMLASLLRAIGGGAYASGPAPLARLRLALELGAGGGTLAGCVMRPGRRGRWLIGREPGRLTSQRAVKADVPILWDRRFVVGAACDGVVAPLGTALLPKGVAADDRLPKLVRATLPALWNGGQVAAWPEFLPGGTLRVRFQPANFAGMAPFVSVKPPKVFASGPMDTM